MPLKLAAGVVAVVAIVVGGYAASHRISVRSLSQTLSERLESGDYLAALAAAGELQKKGKGGPELEATIAQAARFLVAGEEFAKAKKAAEEERWQDARALLRESEAVTNPAFAYYRQAKELLEQAEALAAAKAHETAVKIETLASEAEKAKQRRAEAERQRQSIEKTFTQTLREKEEAISATKAEAAAAAEALRKSREEAEATQAALVAEQARAKALMEQVEKESTQKFFTELRAYRDMAQKGKEQLDSAVTEIHAKRDVTAFVYLSQGKVLFEEAKAKAADLRDKRTPSAYQSAAADLLHSLEQFVAAGRELRNAIVYIEEQGSAEFASSFDKGGSALAEGASSLSKVSAVIAAHP